MKSKKGLAFIFVFAFAVLTLGFVSSTITISDVDDLAQKDGSFTFTVTSDQNETIILSVLNMTQGDYDINFYVNESSLSLNTVTNPSQIVLVNYDVESGFDFDFGKSYSTEIQVNGSVSADVENTVDFEDVDFCESVENKGELKIEDVDFKVVRGFGDDDDYWYLMDEIEVEVNIENDGSWDIDNIELEWELYTTSGSKISDGSEDDFDLKDGNDETVTFTIKLDEDLDEFEGENAVLYIKATGEISDSDSAYDEDETCKSYSNEVEVKSSDKFVVAGGFEINDVELVGEYFEEGINCGAQVTIDGLVTNLGDDDQEEITLEIYSKELGIHEFESIGDVDGFESSEFSFTFTVPSDIDAKNYRIQFEVLDEDDDLFENSEDDESINYVYLKIDGLCSIEAPTVLADMTSEGAYAGKELIITSTVRNNEDREVSFVVSAEGYNEWATLSSVKPEVISLALGESKDVVFTFEIKGGIEGEQSFNIQTYANNKIVETQPVLINVVDNSILPDLDWNWKLIGIVLLNVILVLAIILVLRKIMKK